MSLPIPDSMWCHRARHDGVGNVGGAEGKDHVVHGDEDDKWIELKVVPTKQWNARISELEQLLRELSGQPDSLIAPGKVERIKWLFNYGLHTCCPFSSVSSADLDSTSTTVYASLSASQEALICWLQGIQLVVKGERLFITQVEHLKQHLGKECLPLVDYYSVRSTWSGRRSCLMPYDPSDPKLQLLASSPLPSVGNADNQAEQDSVDNAASDDEEEEEFTVLF